MELWPISLPRWRPELSGLGLGVPGRDDPEPILFWGSSTDQVLCRKHSFSVSGFREKIEKMSNPLASMLDELMGRDRDLAPTEKRSEIKWDDPDVIVFFSYFRIVNFP